MVVASKSDARPQPASREGLPETEGLLFCEWKILFPAATIRSLRIFCRGGALKGERSLPAPAPAPRRSAFLEGTASDVTGPQNLDLVSCPISVRSSRRGHPYHGRRPDSFGGPCRRYLSHSASNETGNTSAIYGLISRGFKNNDLTGAILGGRIATRLA